MMLKKWMRLGGIALMTLALVVGTFGTMDVASAQQPTVAYGASWITSITYQNVSSENVDVTIRFYPESGGSPITYERPEQLNAGAGTSLTVTTVDGIDQFGSAGSAVMETGARVAATPVFLIPGGFGAGRNVRPLSNGFQMEQAASSYQIPTVLNNVFETTSVLAVQNTTDAQITVTGRFYDSTNPTATPVEATKDLGVGQSWIIDAGAGTVNLPDGFNGSAIFTATSGSGEAQIVAAASEYSTTGSNASSFEGVPQGATKIFMPSALCAFGDADPSVGAETAYAIQNASSPDNFQQANVTITYYNTDGTEAHKTNSFTIDGGAKKSALGCGGRDANQQIDPGAEITGAGIGFLGSAVIESDVPIVAIGKVIRGAGLSTAFVGSAAGTGADTVALPYIRWGTETDYNSGARQRAFVAIQNIGANDANGVVVKYQDKDGNTVKQVSLDIPGNGIKGNTSPGTAEAWTDETNQTFGEYADGSFGGGILIEGPSGSELVAVVRIQSGAGDLATGEDYSGANVK
jgi:hypothetical protein